jgi:hypothetical protein
VADLNGHGTFDETAYSADREAIDFDGHSTFDSVAYSWGSAADPVEEVQVYYQMRAWNLVSESYEIWLTTEEPDPTPPSGDPVVGVTFVRWEY